MAKVKRVPLNRLVKPETFEAVKRMAEERGMSEGEVLDAAVALLVEEKVVAPVASEFDDYTRLGYREEGGELKETRSSGAERKSPRQPKLAGQLLRPSERGKK